MFHGVMQNEGMPQMPERTRSPGPAGPGGDLPALSSRPEMLPELRLFRSSGVQRLPRTSGGKGSRKRSGPFLRLFPLQRRPGAVCPERHEGRRQKPAGGSLQEVRMYFTAPAESDRRRARAGSAPRQKRLELTQIISYKKFKACGRLFFHPKRK